MKAANAAPGAVTAATNAEQAALIDYNSSSTAPPSTSLANEDELDAVRAALTTAGAAGSRGVAEALTAAADALTAAAEDLTNAAEAMHTGLQIRSTPVKSRRAIASNSGRMPR